MLWWCGSGIAGVSMYLVGFYRVNVDRLEAVVVFFGGHEAEECLSKNEIRFRPLLDGFQFRLGDGNTSLWYINWSGSGMLANQVLYVDIHDVQMRVKDVYIDGKLKSSYGQPSTMPSQLERCSHIMGCFKFMLARAPLTKFVNAPPPPSYQLIATPPHPLSTHHALHPHLIESQFRRLSPPSLPNQQDVAPRVSGAIDRRWSRHHLPQPLLGSLRGGCASPLHLFFSEFGFVVVYLFVAVHFGMVPPEKKRQCSLIDHPEIWLSIGLFDPKESGMLVGIYRKGLLGRDSVRVGGRIIHQFSYLCRCLQTSIMLD
ncbi:hypothetical protein L195_g014283 [Trifolium pratense]|uniref:Uncharacterized protein n=1 Tax=Trifolium pratense TaxID=57577 RepID=A0A2K3PQI0_TRIPR|nr:hypothetical protein L195_g014283 [Trifolium pratense]